MPPLIRRWLRAADDWLHPKRSRPGAIHPWRWRFLTLWVCIFTAVVSFAVGSNRKLAVQGEQAHAALCEIRGDYKRRVQRGEVFLARNKDGALGFTRAELIAQVSRDRRTLASLNELQDC